jgi:dimethylargininase
MNMAIRFTKAIVKNPCRNLIHGLSSSHLGQPDYNKALEQHSAYIDALKVCGLDVIILEPDEHFPDSTFVEDVALLTSSFAIITNPGALSRKNEIIGIEHVIRKYFKKIEHIIEPGTVEAGDVMMVDKHFFIGLSSRTNRDGAEQLTSILSSYGMTSSFIDIEKALHLKSGVSYIENNNLIASGEFRFKPEFQKFNIIEVQDDEFYAANSLWINGSVIIPEGYPKIAEKIRQSDYKVIPVDVSEFQKIDGGLSCLSLRF